MPAGLSWLVSATRHVACASPSASPLPPRAVCLLLRACARFEYRPSPAVMRRLLAHAEARLPYYRPAELCALLAALAALKFRPAGRITQRLLQKARGKLAVLKVRNHTFRP